MRPLARALSVIVVGSCTGGCIADGDFDSQGSDLREDTSRAPIVVDVPVRFTRNDLADVGYLFSSSWVPFTSIKREVADGYAWGMYSSKQTTKIANAVAPDAPGSGYATAWFHVEIPYATSGEIAYALARVRMESEFIATEVATSPVRRYTPLRARRGSNQPCLSITAGGGLDGKFKAVSLPFEDEGFTERDWQLGDTDDAGVPIVRVIVGTLRFSATCWPENVEGDTHVSAGLAGSVGPAGGFVMMDNSSGQPSGDWATVYVNLVENDKGDVSVGELFSTSGTILRDVEVDKFDTAATAFRARFEADAERAYEDYLRSLQNGPYF